MFNEKLGLIDIGSNTIRLVIYGIDSHYSFVELHNVKTPARLSQYLDQTDEGPVMSQDGIDILIEVLASFKEIAKSFDVDSLHPMATAAIRQSINKDDIFKQAKDALDMDIELISEEKEATYGEYAVTHSMTVPTAITIDIGGGSCEITYFEDKELKAFHSFNFGVVSLKEKFFAGKAHNDADAMNKLRSFVKKEFKAFDWIKKQKVPIIAIGGSARNVASVHQRQVNYPMAGLHGYDMSFEELEATLNIFANTSLEDMEDIDGLSNDRTDIIIPATLVFMELYKTVKADKFIISSQGLREGIILRYINENYNTPLDNHLIRVRSIQQLIRDLPINTLGSHITVDISISLYEQICKLKRLEYKYEMQELLEFSAYIYRFGSFISGEADSQHTFYILSNMNLLGFSHSRRLAIALLASYRNKSLFQQYIEDFEGWLSDDMVNEIQAVGGILKFSYALNDSKTGPINKLKIKQVDDQQFELDIYYTGSIVAEQYRADRHLKHLERAVDGEVSLNFIEK